ncbi:TauD/TfdA family dioxygenase [Streptomyces sp. H39-C1]|uniref:TauD/TfdA family dioxygenase n=1 Tax=Streptomyces sp. H39-C1 TaxID=3004355 RepID=UPI0022AF89CA|nr:TauD/TfdA family dioxygenase [Streptomyces sp. H39-C1]MCZ4102546.1 TauD/TfdA family dioxygenase [Streptomyces sp. H39-C1]
MRRPPLQPFERHFVDVSSPTAQDEIVQRLGEDGLVTVAGLSSRTAVLAFASGIMTMVPHRDSESDGLTTIRNAGRLAWRPGFAGFGSGELAPHTERSGIPAPPRLMLLVCARPAEAGGESLLADGRRVHGELLHRQRDAVRALSQPRTAYFGAGDGHAGEVFTVHDDATVSVRLRFDGLARFSPLVQPYLPHLRSAVAREQLGLPLLAGQGYLLDNRRWFHARNGFTGNRVCWRALGEARCSLPRGFTPEPVWKKQPDSYSPSRLAVFMLRNEFPTLSGRP